MHDNVLHMNEILMLLSGELRAERIVHWGRSKHAKVKWRNEKEKNGHAVYMYNMEQFV